MPEDQIHERIGAWESAGLIDGETAARLRAAEEGRVPAAGPMSALRPRSTFGPAPSIAEVLAYVGAAFLLAAWFVLLGTQADRIDDRNLVWLAAFAGAGIVSVVGGMLFRTGGEHASRAAGVLFAVTVSCAYGAAYFLMARFVGDGDPGQQLGGAVAALVVAILRTVRGQPGRDWPRAVPRGHHHPGRRARDRPDPPEVRPGLTL